MSNDKMREEFERTNGRDHRRQPPKGNNYIDPMAQADWESFQKGWDQSRAALVIELPDLAGLTERAAAGNEYSAIRIEQQARCRSAIEATGVKVKS